jgi:predicted component of type VI protein secretion system
MQNTNVTGRSTASGPAVVKIRVSLKGRPIRVHSFVKDTVTIGRDPDADVFLDNPGISRNHAKIEKTPSGFVVEDLGSANGTYVNDEPIQRRAIENDDVLRVGKFSLWLGLEDEFNAAPADPAVGSTHPETTVLATADLENLLARLRRFEQVESGAPAVATASPQAVASAVRRRAPQSVRLWLGTAFAVGTAVGATLAWLLAR